MERLRQLKWISQDEATELALAFLVAQGFTDAPPSQNAKVQRDIMELESNGEVLAARHDTVVPTVAKVVRHPAGWRIAFPRKAHGDDEGEGIVIVVDADGRRVWKQHTDVCLPLFK